MTPASGLEPLLTPAGHENASAGHAMPAPIPMTFGARIRRVLSIVRRIVGVPDYDTYLAHMQRKYPDCTPMDARTFERERMAEKYKRPGSRCC